jgi:mRNA-degrading endonuclease RelE of RelBE toxin-antitoxin system
MGRLKVDFNPWSSKSSYQDLPEEERQKIKDLLFILEKNNVSESAYIIANYRKGQHDKVLNSTNF